MVDDIRYLDNVVFLRPDGIPVVCFKFSVKYISGAVKIAPEFDDFAWVDGKEVMKYKCIDGISVEVGKTMKLFSLENF